MDRLIKLPQEKTRKKIKIPETTKISSPVFYIYIPNFKHEKYM